MLPSPTRPARHADDSHRIHALPKRCAPCSDESRLLDNVPAPTFADRSTSSLSLLQTSPLRPRESASSNRRSANHESRGHDRIHSPSDRLDSALVPVPATSTIVPTWAASCLNIDAWNSLKQDGLYVALT